MKKYLRGPSGIYEAAKLDYDEFTHQIGFLKSDNIFEVLIPVEQADTIVELCDYIFLFDKEVTIRKITHDEDELVIEWLKEYVELGTEVKLAILTDIGLIYVAKMDKEGELELL